MPEITPALAGQRRFENTDIAIGSTAGLTTILQFEVGGISLEYSITKQKDSRGMNEVHGVWSAFREVARMFKAIDLPPNSQNRPVAVYYTTDRAVYRKPSPTKGSLGQRGAYKGALINKTVDFGTFLHWFRARTKLASEARRESPQYAGDPQLKAVDTAIQTFLTAFKNLELQPEPLNILVEKNGKKLGLAQLSDGERGLLALVVDLTRRVAMANPKDDNPLEGATGVVLIDELELHLHPGWQRQAVDKLRATFPKMQFIATTHSPQIIGQTPAESLIMLTEKDILTVHQSLGMDSNWVLRNLMAAAERSPEVTAALKEIDRLTDAEDYVAAKRKIAEVEEKYGAFPELDSARAVIERIQLLSQ